MSSEKCASLTILILHQYFRFRTPLGSAAAAQHLLCRAVLFPATLWLPVWPLTPTLPAGSLIFWVYRAPEVTWDRPTWAACSEDLLAWLQASTRTISTWTRTASLPVSPLYAWRPKSTVQPYLGRHDVLICAGWGTSLTPVMSKQTPAWCEGALKLEILKATMTTFINVAIKIIMQIHGWLKITPRENNKRFGKISGMALPRFSTPLVGEKQPQSASELCGKHGGRWCCTV